MGNELVKLGAQLSKLIEVLLYFVVVGIDRGFLSLLLQIANAVSDLSQDGSGFLDRLARQPKFGLRDEYIPLPHNTEGI